MFGVNKTATMLILSIIFHVDIVICDSCYIYLAKFAVVVVAGVGVANSIFVQSHTFIMKRTAIKSHFNFHV